MKQRTILFVTLAVSATFPFQALAAKKKSPEIYAATEDGGYSVLEDARTGENSSSAVEIPSQSSDDQPAPRVKVTKDRVKARTALRQQKELPAKARAKNASLETPVSTAQLSAGTPGADPKINFDQVPAGQAESVAQRLKYVEIIIRKYGRAYDYRTMTLRDLQAVLGQLDAASQPSTNSKPVILPPVLRDSIPVETLPTAAPDNS